MDLSLNDLYWHKSDVAFYRYTSKPEGLKEKQEPKDCKFCNTNSIEFEMLYLPVSTLCRSWKNALR